MICDRCIHHEICCNEGVDDEAKIYCADFFELVRCKDCKKYKPYDYPYLCGECENCSYDFPAKIVKEDGYCDEGERKETDE